MRSVSAKSGRNFIGRITLGKAPAPVHQRSAAAAELRASRLWRGLNAALFFRSNLAEFESAGFEQDVIAVLLRGALRHEKFKHRERGARRRELAGERPTQSSAR